MSSCESGRPCKQIKLSRIVTQTTARFWSRLTFLSFSCCRKTDRPLTSVPFPQRHWCHASLSSLARWRHSHSHSQPLTAHWRHQLHQCRLRLLAGHSYFFRPAIKSSFRCCSDTHFKRSSPISDWVTFMCFVSYRREVTLMTTAGSPGFVG